MKSMQMGCMVACLALAGCAGDRPAAPAAAAAAAAGDAAQAATTVAARPPVLETLSPEALRERAVAAMAEQRLYAPAGDNAMEAYLALRDRLPGDGAVSMALAELQPYVMIGTEQALARRDTGEAARLIALMQRVDAAAPALPRLRAALVDTQRAVADAAALAAREQAQSAADALAARNAPAMTAATPAPVRTPAVATGAAPAPQRTPAVAATTPPPPTPQPSPSPSPAVAASAAVAAAPVGDTASRRAPRLTRDAAPQYPRTALARGIEGEVDLAFAVEPDGSVSDVRIVGARPSSIFNDAARIAALRWRFEATGERHATSRTLRFRVPRSS